jgi:hypothetical protein
MMMIKKTTTHAKKNIFRIFVAPAAMPPGLTIATINMTNVMAMTKNPAVQRCITISIQSSRGSTRKTVFGRLRMRGWICGTGTGMPVEGTPIAGVEPLHIRLHTFHVLKCFAWGLRDKNGRAVRRGRLLRRCGIWNL